MTSETPAGLLHAGLLLNQQCNEAESHNEARGQGPSSWGQPSRRLLISKGRPREEQFL